MEEKYELKLRKDMPPGFIKNEQMPELPIITKYLQHFEGKRHLFDEWSEIMGGLTAVLECIPKGYSDRSIMLYREKGVKEGAYYKIACPKDGGFCEFAYLEKIVARSKSSKSSAPRR